MFISTLLYVPLCLPTERHFCLKCQRLEFSTEQDTNLCFNMTIRDEIPLLADEKGSQGDNDQALDLQDIERYSEGSDRPGNGLQGVRDRWPLKAVAIHVLVFFVYAGALFIGFRHWGVGQWQLSGHGEAAIYSPALEEGAVRYVTKKVDGLVGDSVLAERPGQRSDEAWHDLMKGINLRITDEEMESLGGKKSLKLADGSGYLAVLGVYHELHCIKRLRKYIYKDHYYPNMTWDEEQERLTHAEHCLELIRQAAICHGDVTITSFDWLGSGKQLEPTTREGAIHRCVDWKALSGWAEARAVNLFDPGLLEKPL